MNPWLYCRLVAGMCCGFFLAGLRVSAAAGWVGEQFHDGDFPLVRDGVAAPVVLADGDVKVVAIAANDFAADVERVTGVKPSVRTNAAGLSGPVVLIGTLGHSALIDGLVAAKKFDAAALNGKWE